MTNLADSNTDIDSDVKAYLNSLKEKINQNPADVALRELYASKLNENGFIEESIDQYKYLIKIMPGKADLYYGLGLALEKNYDMEGAINAYKTGVKIDDNDVDLHYNLAYALDRSGKKDLAIKEYLITIELDPEDSNAHFNLGYIYCKQGKSREAVKYLSIAAKLNPSDQYAYFYLAYEMQKQGQKEKALQWYKKVLEINPGYSWAYYNMGYIYLESGKINEAYNNFKSAYECNLNDASALKVLLNTAEKIKSQDEIIDLVEKMLAKNLENPLLNLNLAELYFKRKNNDKALIYYQKALNSPKIKDSNIDIAEIQSKIKLLTSKS